MNLGHILIFILGFALAYFGIYWDQKEFYYILVPAAILSTALFRNVKIGFKE